MQPEYKECPECGGTGRLEYDKPIVDWNNGGFIDSEWGDCYVCNGYGEVEIEEEEDEKEEE
jgi:RecJ-like exonuclease